MFVVGYTEGGAPFGLVEWDDNHAFDQEHRVGHVTDVNDEP